MVRSRVRSVIEAHPYASALTLWTIQVPCSLGIYVLWMVALDVESLAFVYLVYILAVFPILSIPLFAKAFGEYLIESGYDRQSLDVTVATLMALFPIFMPTFYIVFLLVAGRPTR